MKEEEIVLHVTLDDNKYYRLFKGMVDTNADEEDIKALENQLNIKLPRKSIVNKKQQQQQEVWLLWEYQPEQYEGIERIKAIYSTEELAQKYCDEFNNKEYDKALQEWREQNNKRPNVFPDEDLEPDWEYCIQAFDVNTE